MNRKIIQKDGFVFMVPSKKKLKKYDVYHDGVYLTSFGAIRPNGQPYEQYEDKISDYYSEYNHYDDRRRANYRKRHKHTNINSIFSPAYWSWHYLW
jgi:hypothetical protein